MTMVGLSLLQAASSDDPYPLYERLVPRGLYFEEGAQLWVAASAAAVTAALNTAELGVRPVDVPVPPALAGRPAGDVLGRLVRMTDGTFQATLKPFVTAALAGADPARAGDIASRRVREILATRGTGGAGVLRQLMFEVPASVVGELCGLPADLDLAALTKAFVGCIPASADPGELAAASPAAVELSQLLEPLLVAEQPGLAGALRRAAAEAGYADTAVLVANAIGLMSQSYDACAGLIGNSLLALGRAGADPRLVTPAFLLEVARHDAPIQNTRRFAHADVELCGQRLRAGQPVLLLLAAANRDPAANPDPARFDPRRPASRLFTFGQGAHACPGRQLAVAIAVAVMQSAVAAGVALPACSERYLPLANARIPVL